MQTKQAVQTIVVTLSLLRNCDNCFAMLYIQPPGMIPYNYKPYVICTEKVYNFEIKVAVLMLPSLCII